MGAAKCALARPAGICCRRPFVHIGSCTTVGFDLQSIAHVDLFPWHVQITPYAFETKLTVDCEKLQTILGPPCC